MGFLSDGQQAYENDVWNEIHTVTSGLEKFLIEKNKAYGNSFLESEGIFSRQNNREKILTRIDDKIHRIKNGKSYPGDDDIKDLTGYLILLMVHDNLENSK